MAGGRQNPVELESELEKLGKNFSHLLKITESKCIHISTFWNDYRREYGKLPDHLKFNLNKRSDFFHKLNEVVKVVGDGHDKFVTLANSKGTHVNTGTKPKPLHPVHSTTSKNHPIRSKVSEKRDSKKPQGRLIGDSSSEDDEGLPEGFMAGNRAYDSGVRGERENYNHFSYQHHENRGPNNQFPVQPLFLQPVPAVPMPMANFYSAFAAQGGQRGTVHTNTAYSSEYPLPNEVAMESRTEQRSRQDAFDVNRDRPASTSRRGNRHSSISSDHGSHTGDRHSNFASGRNSPSGFSRGRGNAYNAVRHTSGDHSSHRGRGMRGYSQPTQPSMEVSKEQLNAVAQDCIDRIAEAKEYVSAERIERLVIQHYSNCNVTTVQDIGLRKIQDINTVHEHIRKQCRVNAYISAFVMIRPIATLHELEESLKDFVTEGQEWESLKLGALQKQPLVYEHFKFPVDKEIPDISTWDVIEMLRGFLSKHNKWTSRDLDMQEFMLHIKEERNLDTPYETGVKIKSLPLAVSVLKRAQRDCSMTVKSVIQEQKDSVQDDVMAAFRHFATGIINKEVGYCDVKKEYLTLTSLEVILEFSEKIAMFYTSLNSWSPLTRNEKKMLTQVLEIRQKLLSVCNVNKTIEAIFRLALCCGRQEIHKELWDILGNQFGGRASDSDVIVIDGDEEGENIAGGSVRGKSSKKPPALSDIVTKLVRYLERCLAQGAINLDLLVKIETKLLDDFDFPDFNALGQGSFLECMTMNDDVKKLLDEYGGTFIGGSQKGSAKTESVYNATVHDVQEFVRQCAMSEPSQVECIEHALCYHYQVNEIKALGHGSTKAISDMAQRLARGQREPCVFYEGAMCSKNRGLSFIGDRQVGILGHQTKEKALACLQNCPLLEDLSEWSHWDLVFHPQLGGLKEFVQKYGKVHSMTVNVENGEKATMTTNIFALENKPGMLLKLTCDPTADRFADASQAGDVVNTCGHLVSMLVTDKGLDNLPIALLGNHMKTALIKMQARYGVIEDAPGGPSMSTEPSKVCQFVVECFTKLPLLVCQAVANKIFLEPLAHVIGSTKSKDQLLVAATTTAQKSRLQIMGFAMGVKEWSNNFDFRVALPKDCLQRVERIDDGMGGIIEDIIESDNESSKGDDVDDDDEDNGTITLSDDEDDVAADQDKKVESVEEIVIKDSSDADITEVMTVDTDSPAENLVEDTGIINSTENSLVKRSYDTNSSQKDIDEEDDTNDTEGNKADKDPCKRVVDQIRREEFGVDVKLSEDAQKLFRKQQERLGRSLDRLSKDLYSKDTHFVLELIQNADDNDYPYEMLSPGFDMFPAVEFLVEKDSISVRNNECGFKEKNIRAVCDVGRSTKGKHKIGYIGQKGIGFKSVFRVTDRPEIHSNGYHICFDIHSGPMGYILPHWIAPESSQNVEHSNLKISQEGEDQDQVIDICQDSIEIMDQDEEKDNEWTTRIVLPIKEDVRLQSQTRSLAARFHDVHPSLLLFLHRLKTLTVINKVENYALNINRRDLPNNIIQIEHTSGTDSWLVVKKMLDASKISIQAKSGVEVESSEIAIAFQLQTKENRLAQVLPEKQPVFAFLPLRSYGFRFVIQGDFDVPSSREDVDRDSIWNQWLRNEIDKLFVEALDTFKSQPNLSDVEAVCSFLQFVPMEDEILDFFRPVSSKILQQLRAKACLPTQPSKTKSVQWKMPSQLVINKDSLVQEVVSSELLQQHLNLDYLHQDVVHALNPSLCNSLGVQSLTTAHLMDIGKGFVDKLNLMDTDIIDAARTSNLHRLSKWLTCIYRSMDEFHPNEEILTQLKLLHLIPLTDSTMIKLEEKTVFFPLADDRKQTKKRTNITFKLIAADINTVDSQLFSALDDVSNSQVRRLLEMLGVKSLTPRDVIHHHIMPVLKAETWKKKPRNIVHAYVTYIKGQMEEDSSIISLDELKPVVVIDTNQGLKKPLDEPVHFTPQYGNSIDLQKVLPGYKWVLLDALYLTGSTTQQEMYKWRVFFQNLGVLDFLALKVEHVTIKREDLDDTPWAQYKEILPPGMESYKIVDFECNEFMSLVAENEFQDNEQVLFEQMRYLFQLLDQTWDKMFKQYQKATVLSIEGIPIKEVDSSFALLLKEVSWLPAAGARKDDQGVKRELLVGSEVYIRDPEIEKLLSYHIPYLYSNVESRSSFSQFLGIKTNVKLEAVTNLLIEWCSPEDDENMVVGPKEFYTSLEHINNVYIYLRDNLPPKRLQDLFCEYPVIFYINPHSMHSQDSSTTDVKGTFLNRDKVRWMDPIGMFDKYKDIIKTTEFQKSCRFNINRLYPGLKDLFLIVGRVQKTPGTEEYGKLLVELTAMLPLPPDALLDTLKLCTVIGEAILESKKQPNTILGLEIEKVKTLLKDKRIIPVFGNKWVYAKDNPLIADDKDKEKRWKNKQGVHFVNTGVHEKNRKTKESIEGVHKEKVVALLNSIGIRKLSECEEVSLTTEMFKPCPALQLYVHKLVPYIQILLYQDFSEVYEELCKKNIKSKLACLQFAKVSKLELVYRLTNMPDIAPIIVNEQCHMENNDQTFFIHQERVEAYSEINKELAQYFSSGDTPCLHEIKDLLLEMLPFIINVHKDLEDFLKTRDLDTLPETEEVWKVPAPLNWPPKPPTPPPGPSLMYMQQEIKYGAVNQQAAQVCEVNELSTAETKPNSGNLKMWPPPAPNHSGSRNDWAPSATGERKSFWPPPAPPEKMDHSSIPEGLRPSKLAPHSMREKSENSTTDQEKDPNGQQLRSKSPTQALGSRPPSRVVSVHEDGSSHYSGDNQYVRSQSVSEKAGLVPGGAGGHLPKHQYPPLIEPNGSQEGVKHHQQGTQLQSMEQEVPKDTDTHEDVASAPTDGLPPAFNRSESQIEMEYITSVGSQGSITVDEQWLQEQQRLGQMKTAVGSRLPMKRQRTDSSGGENSFPRKPVIFYGNPIWTESANESVYQNLAGGKDIEIPENIDLGNDAAPPEIGRWGEQLVKSYFEQVMAGDDCDICEVIWVNETQETGLPYDFIIKVQDPTKEEVADIFIEVKSTLSDKKAFFEISSQELKYAQKWQENFHVYRVFSAGDTHNVKITKIVNLASLLDKNQVKLCMVV